MEHLFNLFFNFCIFSSSVDEWTDRQWDKCGEGSRHIFLQSFAATGPDENKYLDKLLEQHISKTCEESNVRRYLLRENWNLLLRCAFQPLHVAVLTYLKECIFFNIHFENNQRELFSKTVFKCAIWKPVTSSNSPVNMHVLRQQQP